MDAIRDTTVTVQREWPMGHRLQHHGGKCRDLHGHTYRLDATFTGHVDTSAGASTNGMVADFSWIKAVLSDVVMELDHAMVLQSGDPAIEACKPFAKVYVVTFPPTAEMLANWIIDRINQRLPHGRYPSVYCSALRLWESSTTYAEVR
jgi:6-pyruvoyltetrahydropterin/6-carboxytetrahydropterin synthase